MFVVFEQACDAGKITAAGTATACLTSGACTDCAAGKYIAVANGATGATCSDCPAGSHSAAAAGACTVRCTWLGVSCLPEHFSVAAELMHALMRGAFFPYQGDLQLIAVCWLYLNRPARLAR